jgi:drug/metabolite transporter (DMT)-like permease
MVWMVVFVALWVLVEVICTWFHLAYSPFQVVWARYASHLAIMLAIFGWRDPLALIRTRRPLLQIGRSLLMLVMPTAWVVAVSRGLDVDTVLSLFGVSPLLICVLGVLLLKEWPSRAIWMSSVVVSIGALFCLSLQGALPLSGVAAALICAGSFSLYCVLTRMLTTETLRANMFYTALGVFAALTLYMPRVWVTPTAHDAAIMVLVGAVGLISLLALDRAAETAPVFNGGAMVDTRLLTLTGGVLVGRHPDLHYVAGLAVIVAGTICALSLARSPAVSVQ